MDPTAGETSFAICSSSEVPGTWLVDFSGNLDVDACPGLRAALAPLLEGTEVACLQLRLDALIAIDDEGLVLLADLHYTLLGRGTVLELQGCRPPLLRRLEETRLIHLFRLVP